MWFGKKQLHKGKVFQTLNLIIQPFTIDLDDREEQLIGDLTRIFSNDDIILHNPNRRLANDNEASNFIMSTLNGYEKQTNFDYFLFRKDNNTLIGTVHLLAPSLVKSAYPFIGKMSDISGQIEGAWMIEYYLDKPYWRNGIMSLFVKELVAELFTQGAKVICALVTNENTASVSLLEKMGFRRDSKYKDAGGQYLWWKK